MNSDCGLPEPAHVVSCFVLFAFVQTMPLHFPEPKIATFYRQLAFYGFKKVRYGCRYHFIGDCCLFLTGERNRQSDPRADISFSDVLKKVSKTL